MFTFELEIYMLGKSLNKFCLGICLSSDVQCPVAVTVVLFGKLRCSFIVG